MQLELRNFVVEDVAPTSGPSASDHFHSKHFNGAEYVPALDDKRLTGQILRVFALMVDGRWRTLDEISRATGDPAASVSAQLRHLRKDRFGGHTVNRQARGDRTRGLFEYQVIRGEGV